MANGVTLCVNFGVVICVYQVVCINGSNIVKRNGSRK